MVSSFTLSLCAGTARSPSLRLLVVMPSAVGHFKPLRDRRRFDGLNNDVRDNPFVRSRTQGTRSAAPTLTRTAPLSMSGEEYLTKLGRLSKPDSERS